MEQIEMFLFFKKVHILSSPWFTNRGTNCNFKIEFFWARQTKNLSVLYQIVASKADLLLVKETGEEKMVGGRRGGD